MSNNTVLTELIALRDEWLDNANHLTKTIELVKSKLNSEVSSSTSGRKISALSMVMPESQVVRRLPPIPKFNTLSIDAKIVAIIRRENRFVSRDEIETTAKDMGKPFKNPISSSLSSIKRKEEEGLVLYKIGHNDIVWGFKEWLDEDGEIKPEHMYQKLAIAQ